MNHLTDIPFTLKTDQLFRQYNVQSDSPYGKKFEALIQNAQRVGNPKAIYTVSFIDKKAENCVVIDNTVFASATLRRNLDAVERVFPYIVTCGAEIDQIETTPGDILESFWLHLLKGILVETAVTYLTSHIDATYKTGKLASMNPGSGDEWVWPIEQQSDLFSLFVDVYPRIGVRLSEASVLIPEGSLMGILFQTEINFQSCQLCHRDPCTSRRAPFNKELRNSTYKVAMKNDSIYDQ